MLHGAGVTVNYLLCQIAHRANKSCSGTRTRPAGSTTSRFQLA